MGCRFKFSCGSLKFYTSHLARLLQDLSDISSNCSRKDYGDFMKQKKQIILTSVFTALSVLSTLCFCGFRIGFIFVDHIVFDGFCYLLWAIFILNTIELFGQLRGSILGNKLYNKKFLIANIALTSLSLVCCIAFIIIGGKNEWLNYLYVSLETLPFLALFYAVIFFILILPISSKILHKITTLVLCAAMLITGLIAIFPVGGFDFEGTPAVFDTGDGYHIVFATNRKSVGYVKLNNRDGEQILWDTVTGRKESSRVHSVRVSYEDLNNNEYSVGAVRVIEDIAYGGHQGNEITQSVGTFKPCPQDNFNMTCVTDNHSCRPDWEAMGENADVYTFLGDIANGIYTYDSFIDNLIVPAGKISGGVKPVIYVRGNHDHRGNKVPDLLQSLDFDAYYYRLNIGNYVFTVLDSGEDKEDENYEYAGYNDYESYFKEQIDWANSLEKESGYNVILAHSSEFFFEPDNKQSPVCEIMRDLGEELTICGHSHTVKFVPAEESETGIAYYICGGRTDTHEINYTKIHFNQGTVNIVSQSTKGEVLGEQKFILTKAE